MEFFKSNTNIDFFKLRKVAAILSITVCLLSLVSFFVYKLNLGLDFTGGTQIQLSFKDPVDLNNIRSRLQQAGFNQLQVQSFGDSRSALVTLSNKNIELKQVQDDKTGQEQLTATVLKVLPEAQLSRTDFIGGQVSGELAYKGILAVVVAMLATMIYIAFRFEWRLAIGAAVALVHDPVVILGIFSFFKIQFDLTTLAAVLTIIGYSLHDTIVVFDRVRENFRRIRRGTAIEVMNSAINQTLSRTVISSTLTFMVVVVLFLLGGPSIHAFSLALIIGIIVGTYSSIYVAGSLAVALGLSRKDLMVTAKKDFDDRP